MSEIKIWHCPGGHQMGQVVRNGSGVRVLLLYRQALDLGQSAAQMGEIDVIAIIEGYVTDVRCSVCGSVRTWIPGEEALQQLLERVRAMNHAQQKSPPSPAG